jgi:hypothetical protein
MFEPSVIDIEQATSSIGLYFNADYSRSNENLPIALLLVFMAQLDLG